MKTKTFLLVTLLAFGCFTLAWCNKAQSPEENVGIANPASVYCEEQWGSLFIETDEEWNQYGLCTFEDGSYCEEWSFFRDECHQGEIIYNTVDNFVGMPNPAAVYCVEQWWELIPMSDENGEYAMCRFADGTEVEEWEYFRANNSIEENYGEDIDAAEAVIRNYFENQMAVRVENIQIEYLWAERSASELDYCKSLDAEVEECAVFTSDFYIPAQDVEMASAFEPDTTISWYSWYLGRGNWWEWKVLTMGYN